MGGGQLTPTPQPPGEPPAVTATLTATPQPAQLTLPPCLEITAQAAIRNDFSQALESGGDAPAMIAAKQLLLLGLDRDLAVIDASPLLPPEALACLRMGSPIQALVFVEGNVYAGTSTGIVPVDLHDPGAPSVGVELVLEGGAARLSFARGVIYSADLLGFVHSIDISDPAQPRLIRSVKLAANEATDHIHLNGATVMVVEDEKRLRIVDFADPYSPKEVWTYPLETFVLNDPPWTYLIGSESYMWFRLVGEFADAETVALSVSPPDAVELFVLPDFPETPRQVDLDRGFAFMVTGEGNSHVFDLLPPLEEGVFIRDVAAMTTGSPTVQRVAISNDLAFLWSREAGLILVDVSTPLQPSILGSFEIPGDR